MAVFPEQMDRLNVEDTQGSLKRIENYVRYMTERMEFASANTSKVITEAGVSTVGLYQMVSALRDTVGIIQSNMNALSNNMNAFGVSISEMQDSVDAMSEKVSALEAKATTMQTAIDDLTARVVALETPTTN